MTKLLSGMLTLMLVHVGIASGLQAQNIATPIKETSQIAAATEAELEGPLIRLETTQGDIIIELFPDLAPKACENFIGLVKGGYYNNISWHRMIPGFMIQGGDPTGTGRGGQSIWGNPFADEISPSLKFDKEGLLAMANAGPGTNGSQFFITVAPTPWLNGHHTIFGIVVEGYENVLALSKQGSAAGKPRSSQMIIKASVYERPKAFETPSKPNSETNADTNQAYEAAENAAETFLAFDDKADDEMEHEAAADLEEIFEDQVN